MQPISASEFLQFPSPTKLQNISGKKSEAILQHLGVSKSLRTFYNNCTKYFSATKDGYGFGHNEDGLRNANGTDKLVKDECISLRFLQDDVCDVNKSLETFMKIASVVTQDDEKTQTVACECAGLYCLLLR